LNKLQAEYYLNKEVYIVDYGTDSITSRVIGYMTEASNNEAYMYKLKDIDGKLVEHFYDSWTLAHESLIKYHERSVDIEMQQLNKVLEMTQ